MKRAYLLFLLYVLSVSIPLTLISVETSPRLLIKLPTRSRPEKIFQILDMYYAKLSGKVPYHFLISCDIDDESMNIEYVKNKLRSYKNLSFYFSLSKGKVEAVNRDIDKHPDFDVLLVASDDMIPVAEGYDQIIVNKMQEHFPDFDGTLNLYDGHCGGELNTIPIMGKKYYNRFGYVYYPGYQSVCCDLEFTLVADLLNKNAICDELIIRHDHPAYGFPYDQLYRKNESREFHVHDKAIVQNRKATNFDLNYQDINSEKLPTSLDLYGAYNTQEIKWSILICTLNKRENFFVPLYRKLLKQIEDNGLQHKVEVVFFKDNKENTVGYKRNKLLQDSQGQYISFVDDDDDVHFNYVKMIYSQLSGNPDCVSLIGILSWPGRPTAQFVHSIAYQSYFQKGGVFYRPPNHLNPIRRDIAIQFKFPEINVSEDTNWAMQICRSGLLKKEAHIGQPYYHYRYGITQTTAS